MDSKLVRGGAWNSSAEACRSPARAGENPGFVDCCLAPDSLGFRLVRRGPEEPASPSPH